MQEQPDYDELIKPLESHITRFLDGEWEYAEFQRNFQPAIKSYEKAINGKPYWPIDVIADIPAHCRPSLRDYCQQGVERLPKEALDRSTKHWVNSSLIEGEEGYKFFSFFDTEGQSRFGTDAALYSTPVEKNSFLLSSLNGNLRSPKFSYSELVTALRDVGEDELASWVFGTDQDKIYARVDAIWSLGDSYSELYHLQRIERNPADQGGRYLMLIPKSRKWILVNEYSYEKFTIHLHGHRQFITDVALRINVQPDWDWRLSEA